MARVNDGKWHALHLDREGSSGSLALDGETNSFVIPGEVDFYFPVRMIVHGIFLYFPGEATRLHLTGPLYLGGVSPTAAPPPQLWTPGEL